MTHRPCTSRFSCPGAGHRFSLRTFWGQLWYTCTGH